MPEVEDALPLEDEQAEELIAKLRSLRSQNPNQAEQDSLRERLLLGGVWVLHHGDGTISWERKPLQYESSFIVNTDLLKEAGEVPEPLPPGDIVRRKDLVEAPPAPTDDTGYVGMPTPLGTVMVQVPLEPKSGNQALRAEQLETIADLNAALDGSIEVTDRETIKSPADLVRVLVLSLARIRYDFDQLSHAPDPSTDTKHVDKFIHSIACRPPGPINERYAAWWLYNARLMAAYKITFQPFLDLFELYCDFGGLRYRVTGASRLGDVWLAKDPQRKTGYDLRVAAADCSNWGWSAGGVIADDEKPLAVVWEWEGQCSGGWLRPQKANPQKVSRED